MVLVHRELPVLANEHVAGGDKAEGDEFLLEIVDNLLHLGLVDIDDLQSQGELEVEHGRHIVAAQLLGQVEDGVDEGNQLVLRHFVDGAAHHAVHVPDESLALVFHPGQVEQEEDVVELRDEMREDLCRLGEALGDLLEVRQVRQFLPSVGSGQVGIQAIEIGLSDFVANGAYLLIAQQLPFALYPALDLRGLLPVAVVLLQHHPQQTASQLRKTRVIGHPGEIAAGMFRGQNEDFFVISRPFASFDGLRNQLRDLSPFKGVIQDLEDPRDQLAVLG